MKDAQNVIRCTISNVKLFAMFFVRSMK